VLFMAIHYLTPPIRGGERPRLPSTQIGPVTQAIRAMRSTDPGKTETVSVIAAGPTSLGLSTKSETVSHLLATDAAIAAIREGVMRFLAERIERDIALLDALDGDADTEPSLGSIDATSHNERMGQDLWSIGDGEDREAGDDNGLGDYDALTEQGFSGYGRCA
jgi:hypothetical protein